MKLSKTKIIKRTIIPICQTKKTQKFPHISGKYASMHHATYNDAMYQFHNTKNSRNNIGNKADNRVYKICNKIYKYFITLVCSVDQLKTKMHLKKTQIRDI